MAPGRPVYNGPPPGFPARGPPGAGPAGFPGVPPAGAPTGPMRSGSPPSGPSSARPSFDAGGPPPPSAPTEPASSHVPLFSSRQEAQEAFISLLRSTGVTPEWTWEKTMRTIVTEPLYKALRSLSERKEAFNKYIEQLRQQEEQESAERKARAKEALTKLFGERVRSHNSFETAQKWFGAAPQWRIARDEKEARAVFEEIIREKKAGELAQAREVRHRNMDTLMSLFRNFEMDVLTRWKDAHRTVLESEEYTGDAQLQRMDVSDMITVFEEHMRVIEKQEVDRRKKVIHDEQRVERKNRAACKEMLRELKAQGKINANTKWTEIYPLIKEDARFTAMLGQPGSTPLDYFYDIVDELEARLARQIKRIERGFHDVGFKVQEETSRDDFDAQVARVGGWEDTEENERVLIFEDVSGGKKWYGNRRTSGCTADDPATHRSAARRSGKRARRAAARSGRSATRRRTCGTRSSASSRRRCWRRRSWRRPSRRSGRCRRSRACASGASARTTRRAGWPGSSSSVGPR